VALTGPDGLLKALTKTVIETALDEEMSEHLGYDKHDPVVRDLVNSRNGNRSKTVLTGSSGQVDLDVPRDRDGTFEPVIVKKRQPRVSVEVGWVGSWRGDAGAFRFQPPPVEPVMGNSP
jgi:putative transposase